MNPFKATSHHQETELICCEGYREAISGREENGFALQ